MQVNHKSHFKNYKSQHDFIVNNNKSTRHFLYPKFGKFVPQKCNHSTQHCRTVTIHYCKNIINPNKTQPQQHQLHTIFSLPKIPTLDSLHRAFLSPLNFWRVTFSLKKFVIKGIFVITQKSPQ